MTPTGGTSTAWAIVMIVIIPAGIIAAAELDERLRQRRSPLRAAVQTLRNWTLPFFAVWALLVPVVGVDADSLAVRAAATGLVLTIALAVLSALRVIIAEVRGRPRAEGGRAVPQLLLALPRLAIIIATGWILISSVWGVDLSAALTALGVTSLVLSFALQDPLSGLFSGLLLLTDQPFQTGDWIRVGDTVGQVVDVNWRTSRIRDRNGDTIIVPNSEMAGSSLVNYTTPEGPHRVVVPVQVAFMNPPTLAKAMLLDAALGTPGVRSDPPPNVAVIQIDDPLMGYEVHMWIDDYSIEPRVRSDFGSLVWYQSSRHGVPLPSPAQDLYLYDGPTEGSATPPTVSEIRQMLHGSEMLASLPDDDLDRLAHSSRAARFAVGEPLLDSRAPSRGLVVIVEGRAQLLYVHDDGQEIEVAEIGDGDIVGLLTLRRAGASLLARAVTDCEILVVDSEVAGEVASRNADLAAALNRMTSIRRRRVDRILDRLNARSLQAEEGS